MLIKKHNNIYLIFNNLINVLNKSEVKYVPISVRKILKYFLNIFVKIIPLYIKLIYLKYGHLK